MDDLKRRRLDLLWQGYKVADPEGVFVLDSTLARAAGYLAEFGERDYIKVLEFDVAHLERTDRAIVEAADHRSASLPDFTGYRLTDEGYWMLMNVGYPIDPRSR